MGWRFRKSIKILPGIKINIGKDGFSSVSVGTRGAHLGKFYDFFPVAKQIFITEHFANAAKMVDHTVHTHDMVADRASLCLGSR